MACKTTTEENYEILIVEDDEIMSRLLKFQLIKCGHRTPLTFGNGKEAINHLAQKEQEGKNFLILLDINMPIMNGWEFLRKCHSKNFAGKIHIVMITSSSSKEDFKNALKFQKVYGYFTKPLQKENIAEILELTGLMKSA